MKPIEKIYFAFFISRKKRLYFNELKEISGLKDSSLDKTLRDLIDKNEINKEKLKSNTFYCLKNYDLKSVYFAKFSIEKLNSLDYKIKIPLNDFKNSVTNIKYIIHFGSTSRGQENKKSDIDLVIVLNSFIDKNLNELYQKEIRFQIEEIKKKINSKSIYPISCFFVTEQDFINTKEDDLLESSKQTGYPIYNQLEYFIKNEYWEIN